MYMEFYWEGGCTDHRWVETELQTPPQIHIVYLREPEESTWSEHTFYLCDGTYYECDWEDVTEEEADEADPAPPEAPAP